MPEIVHCPSCRQALQVPEELFGHTVQCVKCQATFVAESESVQPSAPRAPELPPSTSYRPSTADDFSVPDFGPAAGPRQPLDDDEDRKRRRPFEDDEDYEVRSRRSARDVRSPRQIRARVMGPAVSLIITACMGFVIVLAQAINFVNVMEEIERGGRRGDAYVAGRVVGSCSVLIVFVVCSLLTLIGAIRMMELKSYGMAMTSAIMAIVPLGCCILPLPFGIWALVVLSSQEVRSAFR